MAKKTVASLQDKSKNLAWAKVIRSVKSPKTGAFTFKEEMILAENVVDHLAK